MNYSAVAPPVQSGSLDPQSAFADALARARQIAAKINQPGDSEPASLKRPYEGVPESEPEVKKMASLNDPIGAQLRAIADQQRATQASQAAAAAAAQINAKLGIPSNTSPPSAPTSQPTQMPPSAMMAGGIGAHAGLGMVTTEEYCVPDRMVGLIIGKGGEQIAGIQAETGCKVQFAPDSGGRPDRPCSLTGTPEAIANAKGLVDAIIAKGQGMPDPQEGGVTMLEIKVPGNKVGLVIGKGGETIKSLQERAGVKMVMIQDSNVPSNEMKPLRITGELNKCQKARDLVMELIVEKDGAMGGSMMPQGMGDYHGGGQEIPVPRNLVGVVIGKGGEMIKKIQSETGAKVQFRPDDGSGPDRMCSIMGPQDRVQPAVAMIQDLVESALQRQNGPGGMGRGRGQDMNHFDNGPGGGGDRFGGGPYADEATFNVPTEKCGLVIGKGGETIRELNRLSGAHVELSRHPPPGTNPRDRVFKVQGNPDQIQHAMRLIAEKAGLPPPNQGGGPQGPPGGPPGQGPPGGFNQYGQFGGQNPQQQAPPPQQGPGPTPGNYAPQGWNNSYQQWNQNTSPDPSRWQNGNQDKQVTDVNAAAWAAYYQTCYNQGNQQQQQQPGQPQQQHQQQQQPAAPQQQMPQQQQPQAAMNPQTGQPDYSAAWAEYYRQQGMINHAQAIMSQAAAGGANQGPQPPQ